MTTIEIIKKLEHQICNSIFIYEGNDFSTPIIFALAGQRVASFLTLQDIPNVINDIQFAQRQHIPIVLHISDNIQLSNVSIYVQCLNNFLCFFPSTSKEYEDLTIIAHKIAETALCPVIIISDAQLCLSEGSSSNFNYKEILNHPYEKVESCTPSQRILFGEYRRQIPKWFSINENGIFNQKKSTEYYFNENITNRIFFDHHLNSIIKESLNQFNKKYNTNYYFLPDKPNNTSIISYGHISTIINNLILKHKLPFSSQKLLCNYFPKEIFENNHSFIIQKFPLFFVPEIFFDTSNCSFVYTDTANEKTIEEFLLQLKSPYKRNYYLNCYYPDIDEELPQLQSFSQSLVHAYPELKEYFKSKGIKKSVYNFSSPTFVKNFVEYEKNVPNFKKISHFFNLQLLYENNFVIPQAAIPYSPSLSSEFKAQNPKYIPEIDNSLCNACGKCFTFCHSSALIPQVNTIDEIIGTVTRELQFAFSPPEQKKLIRLINNQIKDSENNEIKIYEIIDNFSGEFPEKVEELKQISKKIRQSGLSSWIKSETFFTENEQKDKESGKLFRINLHIHRCDNCKVCENVCPEEAISFAELSGEKGTFLLDSLPDISIDYIKYLIYNEKYNPFSSVLLSRYFNQIFTGGHSPLSNGIRLFGAVLEMAYQNKYLKAIAYLEDIKNKLQNSILKLFENDINFENNKLLFDAINDLHDSKVTLSDLLKKLSEYKTELPVDKTVLQRKSNLIKELISISDLFKKGCSGLGKARNLWILQENDEINNIKTFPYNHFFSPTVISWKKDFLSIAKAYKELFVKEGLEIVKLMRIAKLESQNKYKPEVNKQEIEQIDIEDLDENEKSIFTPIVVVVDMAHIHQDIISGIIELSQTKYPIKFLLLDSGYAETKGDIASLQKKHSVILSIINLINLTNINFSQVTPNISKENFEQLYNEIASFEPSISSFFTADFNKHITKDIDKLTDIAVKTRIFPILSHNENNELNIDENPATKDKWIEEDGDIYSPLNWINTLNVKDLFFNQSPDGDANFVALKEFLNMSVKDRTNLIPYIKNEEKDEKIFLSPLFVKLCNAVETNWNAIKKLAGKYEIKKTEHIDNTVNKIQKKDTELIQKEELKKLLQKQLLNLVLKYKKESL